MVCVTCTAMVTCLLQPCTKKKKKNMVETFIFYSSDNPTTLSIQIQYTMTVSLYFLLCVQVQNGTWSEWRWLCWMSMTMSQNGSWLLLRTWLWFPLMLLQAQWFINSTLRMVMKATMAKWSTSCQMVGLSPASQFVVLHADGGVWVDECWFTKFLILLINK